MATRRVSEKLQQGRAGVFWFLVAATQLATQLQQRCKEALKRLTESNGTPAMDLGHMDVVLK